jgi:hypothetical protein
MPANAPMRVKFAPTFEPKANAKKTNIYQIQVHFFKLKVFSSSYSDFPFVNDVLNSIVKSTKNCTEMHTLWYSRLEGGLCEDFCEENCHWLIVQYITCERTRHSH